MRSVVVGAATMAACVGAVGITATSPVPAEAVPLQAVDGQVEDVIVVDGREVPALAEFPYKPCRTQDARGAENPECVLRLFDFVEQTHDDGHKLVMPVQTLCEKEVGELDHTVRLHYQHIQRGWRAVVGSTGAFDFWKWDMASPWEARKQNSSSLSQTDTTVNCHQFTEDRPEEWGGQAQGSVMFDGVEWVAYGYTTAANTHFSGCAVQVNF